jgi:argininosuccinate synthase
MCGTGAKCSLHTSPIQLLSLALFCGLHARRRIGASSSTTHVFSQLSTQRSILSIIKSFAEISLRARLDEPIVTLFSGGLDSTYLVARLRDRGYRQIHGVYVEIGQSDIADSIESIARSFQVELHQIDAQDEFTEHYIRFAIQAQAKYLQLHPISSSLSRPLIAEKAVAIANTLGASAVLHSANSSQNTLRRLNGAIADLGWQGHYGSPYVTDAVTRIEKQVFLHSFGNLAHKDRSTSGDTNLWCREFESGLLDDPELHEVPESLWLWTRNTAPPGDSTTVTIRFRSGILESVNGTAISLREAIRSLNTLVGLYGIGRFSGLEHVQNGHKALEIREMPAAHILLETYRHLESATLEYETHLHKSHIEQIWTREAIEGRWFGKLRNALQQYIQHLSQYVTGDVTWKLSNGRMETLAIRAARPLYIRDRDDWEISLSAGQKIERPQQQHVLDASAV